MLPGLGALGPLGAWETPAACFGVGKWGVDPQIRHNQQDNMINNWGCIKTNLAIFGGMNIHLPVIWGSLGYQGFDSYPIMINEWI